MRNDAGERNMPPSCAILLRSYHHHNTEKVARAIASILECGILDPREVEVSELSGYDVIGFGSGIYHAQHHTSLVELAGRLDEKDEGKAFLFSTTGAPGFAFEGGSIQGHIDTSHRVLREALVSKGYDVLSEFMCPGHNTNSFLRYFGGLNKGRPNAGDILEAKEFARKLLGMVQ